MNCETLSSNSISIWNASGGDTFFFFHSFGRTIWGKLLEFTFEIDEGEFKPFKTFGYWIITADQQALCTETNIF